MDNKNDSQKGRERFDAWNHKLRIYVKSNKQFNEGDISDPYFKLNEEILESMYKQTDSTLKKTYLTGLNFFVDYVEIIRDCDISEKRVRSKVNTMLNKGRRSPWDIKHNIADSFNLDSLKEIDNVVPIYNFTKCMYYSMNNTDQYTPEKFSVLEEGERSRTIDNKTGDKPFSLARFKRNIGLMGNNPELYLTVDGEDLVDIKYSERKTGETITFDRVFEDNKRILDTIKVLSVADLLTEDFLTACRGYCQESMKYTLKYLEDKMDRKFSDSRYDEEFAKEYEDINKRAKSIEVWAEKMYGKGISFNKFYTSNHVSYFNNYDADALIEGENRRNNICCNILDTSYQFVKFINESIGEIHDENRLKETASFIREFRNENISLWKKEIAIFMEYGDKNTSLFNKVGKHGKLVNISPRLAQDVNEVSHIRPEIENIIRQSKVADKLKDRNLYIDL